METTPQRRSARIGLTGALSALVVVLLVAAGGVGFARSSVGPAQYQYGKKVTICHKGKVTITISRSALPAHLAHEGTTLGPCKDAKKKKKKKQEAKKKAEQKAEQAKEKAKDQAEAKKEKAEEKAKDKAEKAEAKKEKAEEAVKKEEKGDDHGKSDEDHGKGQDPGKGKK
jgi:outer membrane biosynthesis protein TonB